MIEIFLEAIKRRVVASLDLLFLFGEKAFRILISAVTGIVVARTLGAERYGELSAAIATATVFAATAGMSADHINIGKLSNGARVHVYRLLISARLAIASLLTAVYILVCLLADSSMRVTLIRLALAPIVLASAYNVNQHLLLANQRYRVYTAVSLLVMIAGSVAKLLLSLTRADTIFYALSIASEAVLLVIMYNVYAREFIANQINARRVSFRRLRRGFTPFIPGLISAVIVSLAVRVEIIIVASNMSDAAAGEWAAATMFLTPWLLLASSLTPMINVKLAALRSYRPIDDYIGAVRGYIRAFLLLGALGTIATAVIAVRIGPSIFGARYPTAPLLAATLSVAIAFQIQGVLQDVWLAQAGRRVVALKKAAVTLFISALFAYIASTTGQLIYVGVASVLSSMIGAVLLNSIFDREYFRMQVASLISLLRGRVPWAR